VAASTLFVTAWDRAASKSRMANLGRVEMIVPEGGFGKRLDKMHDWHLSRSIKPRSVAAGVTKITATMWTWCFADAAMTDSFRASFVR